MNFYSANTNDGTFLAVGGNIIVVHINYQLTGLKLGFLTVENSTYIARANLGLKDQVFALRWIQDNIAYFGGNPKDVTLFGTSTGGPSITSHALSPMS